MEDFIMLNEIKTKEIMTTWDAIKKYPTKYFIMIITEVIDKYDNDLGYVIYTADNQKELTYIPREEYKDMQYALLFGDEAEPFPSVGNVVYYD